jgi:ribulose 1,5-bisphosphate synthetase/thiazole synthase
MLTKQEADMHIDRRDTIKLLALGSTGTVMGASTLAAPDPAPPATPNEAKKTVREPARDIPVDADYDVIVVGGGIAGVAAAVASARLGAKTALLEKEYALGGLATLGNVVIYLPICDGKGNKVMGGLGEEMLRVSLRDGNAQIPEPWQREATVAERSKHRYRVTYNAASYILSLEEFIVENGVDLWYDTRFCHVDVKDDRIQAVIVENKSGRRAMTCRNVVDATGDADVCAIAGEPTISQPNNVASAWYYYTIGGKVKLDPCSQGYSPDPSKKRGDGRTYAGDNARDVTDQILHARRMVREHIAGFRKKYDRQDIFPQTLATFHGFRMTRRLNGETVLQHEDAHRWFDDCIGLTGDWRKAGPVFALPYKSLIAVKTKNLITAGRCISSAGQAWDVTRVIPTCSVTGEAAGTAAAMSAKLGDGFRGLSVPELQAQLGKQGVLLDRKLVEA